MMRYLSIAFVLSFLIVPVRADADQASRSLEVLDQQIAQWRAGDDPVKLDQAYEVAAGLRRTLANRPVTEFIRERPVGDRPLRDGRPLPVYEVYSFRTGEYAPARGEVGTWIERFAQEQARLRIERFDLLIRLGTLRLEQPEMASGAVKAYEAALDRSRYYTQPIDELIEQQWPFRPEKFTARESQEIARTIGALDLLAKARLNNDDRLGAVDAASRSLLLHFKSAAAYESGLVYRQTQRLWELLHPLSPDVALPAMVYLKLLTPKQPEAALQPPVPQENIHLYASVVAPAPGQRFKSLDVSADMINTTGQTGSLHCYMLINGKHQTLADLHWPAEALNGFARVDQTIEVPEAAGPVFFEVRPRPGNGQNPILFVTKLRVKAAFMQGEQLGKHGP